MNDRVTKVFMATIEGIMMIVKKKVTKEQL